MNQLLKYTLLLFLVTFAACSSEDDAAPTVPNGQLQPGDAFELTVSTVHFVTDGTPDTRATDNDEKTTFKDGDRVGIIILGENSHPIYDNIPYVYENGKWTFDSGNDEGKGGCYYDTKAVTYIVYYPYSRAADKVTSVDDLKTKFAPRFNQSDIKDYRSSDLMVCSPSPLTSSKKELDAVLKHAFASVFLAPIVGNFVLEGGTAVQTVSAPDISDVSLTTDNAVYIPFQANDGSLRCIVPAGTPSDIRCFYTIGSKTYGNKITISGAGIVAANTRYACQPEINNVTYSLGNAHVGDFYCMNNEKEGYLIPGDVSLSEEQQKACIGIVFWVGSEAFEVDPLLKKDHPDYSHGLVVALKDAGSTMNWSQKYEYVQNWVHNSYNSDLNIQRADIMCGYSNTLALMAYNETRGVGNEYLVLPCDAIRQYSDANPVPTNSSGWYLPSIKELQFVCRGQGQSGGTAGCSYLNTQISKVSGGSPFVSDRYWSSTEGSSSIYYNDNAWGVNFGSGKVYDTYKCNAVSHVRLLLAF